MPEDITPEAPSVETPAPAAEAPAPTTLATARQGADAALAQLEKEPEPPPPTDEPPTEEQQREEEATTPAATGEPVKYDEGPTEPPATDATPPATVQLLHEGQIYEVTPEQRDQYLQMYGAQSQAAAQAEAPVDPADRAEAALAEMKQIQAEMKQAAEQAALQASAASITESVKTGIEAQQVFKDNPEMAAFGRKLAMADLLDNPRMSEADAVTKAAQTIGKEMNKIQAKYVAGKVKASQSAEGGSGGAVVTPAPKALTGRDLKKGNVLRAAMAATSGTQFYSE